MDNKNDDMFSYPVNEDSPIEPTPPLDQSNLNPIEDGNSGRSLVWLILGIVLFGCGAIFVAAFLFFQPNTKSLVAQYFPSATPTFTHTPTTTPSFTPTPTQTATPTPNLTATAQAQQITQTAVAIQGTATSAVSWKILLSEPFDTNKNEWLTGTKDGDYSKTNYKIEGGKYIWDITSHKSFIGWVKASTKSLDDFYLSTDVNQPSGPNSSDYGVIFREDTDSNFYYFGINNRGQYILLLYFNEWITLVDWTNSDLILTGKPNHITVIGNNSHFTFFINNQYLTDITDDRIPKGIFAMAAEMDRIDENAVFEFDNFELRAP